MSLFAKGKRKGHICCAPSCEVCTGATCAGACCAGHIIGQGRSCEHADDVTCLIPRVVATNSTSGVETAPQWCRNGKADRAVCCASTCPTCGGPSCSGACCGGYVASLKRTCVDH